MVRVAGLHDQIEAGVERPRADGRTPSETLGADPRARARAAARGWRAASKAGCCPALAEHGIVVRRVADLDDERARGSSRAHFQPVIFPALTPLAVGPGQPFPYISNLSLSLAVLVRDPDSGHDGVRAREGARPRSCRASSRCSPAASALLVPLEDVIAHHLDALFPGMEIADYDFFRVTRDADLEISDDAADLLQAVEDELRRRRFGEVVRVEVGAALLRALRDELTTACSASTREVYPVDGLLDMGALWRSSSCPATPSCARAATRAVTHPRLLRREGERPDVMGAMREGDLLVHHPYDSFSTSVERFVEQAVADPHVLAIKQTVYRTSDDSPLVPALIRATERGKQAVALVELQARFDERTNIHWAKALEQAGVHVVYGQPAMKTHAKCVLVVRREGDGVRNYVHIGTGNYHSATARLYTDFGLFTTDEQIGADVADMFNYLTGYGRPAALPQGARRAELPARRHHRARSSATIDAHSPDSPARIAMKMNALVDGRCIRRPLRGLAGRRAGRPQRPRDLLPAPGPAGDLREHPRRLDRRAAARALARVRLRARRRADGLHRLGRPDAAQPRPPRRAGGADRGRRSCAPTCSTRSSARSPTTRTPGNSTATASGPARARTRRTAPQPAARARRALRGTRGEHEPRGTSAYSVAARDRRLRWRARGQRSSAALSSSTDW